MALVLIVLEIDGDQAEAFAVVDRLLDAGTIQEQIHEYCWDGGRGPLLVTSATCTSVDDYVAHDDSEDDS